jgi:hypothetical protein
MRQKIVLSGSLIATSACHVMDVESALTAEARVPFWSGAISKKVKKPPLGQRKMPFLMAQDIKRALR